MRSKKLDETLIILSVVGALAAGCGGDVKSPGDDEGTPPNADAGTGKEPEAPDAGSAGEPRTPATPASPTAPTPEGRATPENDERLIGALTKEELKDLCEGGRKQIVRALKLRAEVQCTGTAVLVSKTPDECNAKRSMCIAQGGASPSPLDDDTCETDALMLAEDCADVSVADVRACSEAWTKQLEQAAEQVDCSMTGMAAQGPALEEPAECQNIDARCMQ